MDINKVQYDVRNARHWIQQDLSKIESEIKWVRWMVTFNIGITVAIAFKLFLK